MKQKNQTASLEYQKRVQKALNYIRENLDKPISLADVAAAACFSEYHFHRIFSALMNETIGEYITRKKLERAAMKLAYSSARSVSDVAEECGYSSVSSFSKAFNQWFGCRPTEFYQIKQQLESRGGKLQTKYEKSIEANQLYVDENSDESNARFNTLDKRVRIDTKPQVTLYYLTSPAGYDYDSIRETWINVARCVEDANIDFNQCERFAISHDHPGLTPPELCRYDAGVSLPGDLCLETSLLQTTIPAGRYATFAVEGPEHSILPQYLEFYTVWMPQSGYEPDNYPVVERYLAGCQQGHLNVELWAKINTLSLSS